jgi:predicted PurR-regulated permease PerM
VANGKRSNGHAGSYTLFIVLVIVAVLFFARTVFIPLALSILLSFMLAPLVIRLQHWGLGRIPSTGLVVLIAFVILASIGAVMTSQLADLAHKLPEYQHNVHQKVESIRNSGGGLIKRISGSIQKFSDELTPPSAPKNQPAEEERPVPVEIRRTSFSPMESIQKVLGSIVSLVVTAMIVIVFVIFMLIQQEDLRDRLIRLAGSRRVNLTTNMLDDAANRVSRYLLAQFVVNSGYGIVTGTVLYFIHVPNPLLWAMLAALFRYVPYLGIWIAAVMPAAVAFAVQPGWITVPIVFGVYIGVDLLMYNFAEPLLYGSSTGLSPLAILVAAVFWTWLWGPAGLLLATPLTVCVVVVGRHLPNFAFLQILLSDEPVLSPKTRFYQRMLSMDVEEATQICEEFLKKEPLETLYDEVIIPALALAEEDRHRGKLDEQKEEFIFQNTRALVEGLGERCDQISPAHAPGKGGLRVKSEPAQKIQIEPIGPSEVLCIPARDRADELAALMLKQLLQKQGISAKALQSEMTPAGLIDEVNREGSRIVCILAVPPFAYMHTRYLCRRLRSQFKSLKLVSGILTENGGGEPRQSPGPAVVDETASSLKLSAAKIMLLAQMPVPAPSDPAGSLAEQPRH